MAKTGTITFYKSMGAAQFTLLPPRYNAAGFVEKPGAILLEVAPGDNDKRDPSWDWDRKISFAFGFTDIVTLSENIDEPKKLFHKNEKSGTIKTVEFVPGRGDTYLLQVGEKDHKWHNIMVPLSLGEQRIIVKTMIYMIPELFGWRPTP